MDRSPDRSRALFLLLLLLHVAAFFAAGGLIVNLAAADSPDRSGQVVVLLVVTTMLVVARGLAMAQLPAVVRNAHWRLLRPMVCWELAAMAGLAAGMKVGPEVLVCWPLFIVAGVALCPVALAAARGGECRLPEPPSPFFLLHRGHAEDWSARRHVAASAVMAGLAAALMTLMESAEMPLYRVWFVAALALGILITAIEINPVRAPGFVPFGFLFVAAAAVAFALIPGAVPAGCLGFGAGLAVATLVTALLMQVPPRQRFIALVLTQTAAALAGIAGSAVGLLSPEAAKWLAAALAAAGFVLILKLYFREFAEIIMEAVFYPMYRFDVRGPGLYLAPTRGPCLIIANHAAYFDPLFLCKVVPLSVRAMMISTMFDRPFLKWLAGDVYRAIRVQNDAGFRRHAPEIDEAVAALKSGESVMIFPEGWLRRKEEKPIHRFAQGVHRILKEAPDTPVLPCWIEDSWGSYLSYKDGPPTKNKKFDWWFRMRLAIAEPAVLPAELLEDHKATRRRLMELVLHARTYLGLPPHPMPGAAAAGEEDDAEKNASPAPEPAGGGDGTRAT